MRCHGNACSRHVLIVTYKAESTLLQTGGGTTNTPNVTYVFGDVDLWINMDRVLLQWVLLIATKQQANSAMNYRDIGV